MDSLTQAVLGATVAGAVAGKQCNAKVLLAGAALGTLPDLDVLISYSDPVMDMVKHRGFSHSLFVLFGLSLVIAKIAHHFLKASWSFKRLFALVGLVLITHTLLDAFTSYGTQLLWPLPGYFAVSSIFIIDPAYTLPLLLAIPFALFNRPKAARYCNVALSVSSLYLLWSVVALSVVEGRVQQSLVDSGRDRDLPVFISPTPFNTILWRVVVLDGDNYLEGLSSVLDKSPTIAFIERERGTWPLADEPQSLLAQRNFAGGFVRYREQDQQLIVSDLRMGMADFLAFQFSYAQLGEGNQWDLQIPEQLGRKPGAELYLPKLFLRMMGDQEIDANLCRGC
ncbi:metal-dependent hydrolase [Aliagarivorans marinus]|uniref:metal-dependent hydrolase n=1 Tax=Aliagarivorans marinus TaxID=561965 RepID=UPI000418FBF4|nr:metal-dependent hydrolase [Aliagarivorans marinus]